MPRSTSLAALLPGFALALAPLAAVAADGTGMIEGRVLNARSGE